MVERRPITVPAFAGNPPVRWKPRTLAASAPINGHPIPRKEDTKKTHGRPAQGKYPEDFVKEMCLEVYAGAGWAKGDWESRVSKVGQDGVRKDAEHQYRALVVRFLDALHRVGTDQPFFTELFGDVPERS